MKDSARTKNSRQLKEKHDRQMQKLKEEHDRQIEKLLEIQKRGLKEDGRSMESEIV
jgi:hypothetical protein